MRKTEKAATTSNSYLLAITCYNCEPQIGRVLGKITPELADRMSEVMVIDNRSEDRTAEKALEVVRTGRIPNLHVYRNKENYSLGGSHKVAFLHALDMGATHVVILHGDDQADPADIPALLDVVETGVCTTALGSRFNRKSRLFGYDWKRILGNRVLNVVYTVLTMRYVEDLGSGLNVFAVSDMDMLRLLNFADRLTFNFELLLDLIDRGVKFAYVPITWREEDQVSNARNFNIAWTAFKNLCHWRFRKKTFFGGPKTAKDYITVEVVE
ncbi:MAG: glycosyltransferase family 2 protein [Atopobiaceae bacterium]|nr:glycosyltransferase family 2 protein [Atopobiaceae bacterium]